MHFESNSKRSPASDNTAFTRRAGALGLQDACPKKLKPRTTPYGVRESERRYRKKSINLHKNESCDFQMNKIIEHKLYTMVMIEAEGKVLLINRPDQLGFPGYIVPGGKVDFPESIVEGAIREVKEETGLIIKKIEYKGLDKFCEPNTGLRYMVFNYLATEFEGELLDDPPEGELEWVDIEKIDEIPVQDWFRRRFPLFFRQGTFELSFIWDSQTKETIKEVIKEY